MTRFTLACAALACVTSAGCSHGAPRPLHVLHQDALVPGDHVVAADASYCDDYPIEVEAGWRIEVVMIAEGFQPYLWIIPPARRGERGEPPPQQGSAPGTHTVALAHVARRGGRYVVRANSNMGGELGAYSLEIRTTPPPASAAPGETN